MSMRHFLRFIPALAILVSALASPAAAPGQDRWEIMRERFDGVWRLAVPVATARRTVYGAIDDAVGAMNYFLRGVARPLIRDNTPVNEEIELRFREGNRLYTRFDQRARYTSPLNGTRRVTTPDGDPMRVTQRFRGDTLEQVFEADNGTRWNVYTILPDGRMRMSATTNADMMPEPLRFSLTYRRQ